MAHLPAATTDLSKALGLNPDLCIIQQPACALCEEHLSTTGNFLQALCQVHRVANGSVVQQFFGTDIAYHSFTGGNADTKIHAQLGWQSSVIVSHSLAQPQCSAGCPQGMILLWEGCVKDGHDQSRPRTGL